MKSAVIDLAGKLGGYQLARVLTRKQPKILMYHRFVEKQKGHEVTAATFEHQLQVIKRYFQPMTLAGLAQSIRQTGRAPNNAVVITVDDGYRDFYEIAYPLLKHYSVPATFFVTTGFVSQDFWLWYDQVRWILLNKKNSHDRIKVSGLIVDLEKDSGSLWSLIVNHFLQISNKDRLQGMEELINGCNVFIPAVAPCEYEAVTWTQLAEMQRAGIEIGGHTVTHPSLGMASIEEARFEIARCKKDIEHELGPAPRTFCYPNGQPQDYTEAIKLIVKEAGFLAAVTAFSDRHNILLENSWRRFTAAEESFQFKKSLYGVEHMGNIIKKHERSKI